MAGKHDIQNECNRLNSERDVIKVGRCTLRQFWNKAQPGFLITGGSEQSRTRTLCSKLCCDMQREDAPTFVLTTSEAVEADIIRRIREGAYGSLRVSSRHFNNYHFFYRWANTDIERFMIQAAEILGYNCNNMPIYIHAFLDILSRCYPPSLSSLSVLAAYDDKRVAEIGKGAGADPFSLMQIIRYSQEGEMFRLVLCQVVDVFSPLSIRDCNTRYNLSAIKPRNQVYLVNFACTNPELIQAYFAIELRLAMNHGYRFRLVYSDIFFKDEAPLKTLLRDAQLSGNVEVGVSTQNAAVMLGGGGENFPSRVILLDAGYADSDLETVLKPLGTFTFHEPGLAGGRPAQLISFFTDERWDIHPEAGRLRVRPADVRNYSGIFYGASGNSIVLARKIIE